MQKFSEIQYVRPDLDAFAKSAQEHVENIKNAESYAALKAEILKHDDENKNGHETKIGTEAKKE